MSKSIQIVRQSTVELPDISSYKLVVQTANPENMPGKIFVKQRIRNFAQDRTDDTFVAVCTPTQLEDFEEDAPAEGSSYFRTDSIELIARTPEYLMEVFDSLIYEVKKLVIDLSDLDVLTDAEVYTITASEPITRVFSAPVINTVARNRQEQTITVNFTAPTFAEIIDYQYSLDGGLTWRDRTPRSISSPLVIQNVDSNTTYNLIIRAYLGGGSYGASSIPLYIAPVV